jgi:site-specific recombinase XerD
LNKTQSISIRKGLILYKQPQSKGRGSPNWYVRVHREFGGRYTHTKTTGTSDLKLAEHKAEEYWMECLLNSRYSQEGGSVPIDFKPNLKTRFDHIADAFLTDLESRSGADPTSQRNLADYKSVVHSKNGFARFFGKDDIGSITTDRISEFLTFQRINSRKGDLAATSQKRTLVTLNVILKFAYQKRFLATLPMMPKIKTKDNPRAWFEKSEYMKLMATARSLAKKARKSGDLKAEEKWLELNDFIMFMVNSFLRPSEWASLQQQHVKVVLGTGKRLEISVIKGKTGVRTTYSMPSAVTVYNRILKRTRASPNAYLFKGQYVNRQTAMERMRDDFDELLHIASLKNNSLGMRRTIYSLRHTSLMLRITEGDNVNILGLAKNAGTSVDQLERFYLKRLSPLTMLDNLQSFKKRL